MPSPHKKYIYSLKYEKKLFSLLEKYQAEDVFWVFFLVVSQNIQIQYLI